MTKIQYRLMGQIFSYLGITAVAGAFAALFLGLLSFQQVQICIAAAFVLAAMAAISSIRARTRVVTDADGTEVVGGISWPPRWAYYFMAFVFVVMILALIPGTPSPLDAVLIGILGTMSIGGLKLLYARRKWDKQSGRGLAFRWPLVILFMAVIILATLYSVYGYSLL